LAGNSVVTHGVITAIGFRALYVQDPNGDRNNATSDAIFVFDFGWGGRRIGDCVELDGTVSERIAGGAATGNLSTTQMFAPDIIRIDCETTFGPGYSFPDPTVIGFSGRVPPNEITISEDEIDPPINLQLAADDAANNFDPYEDGIDFYESMESMLVTVEDAQAVSATRRFSSFSAEFFTVPNRADTAIIEPNDAMTQRGGIVLQPDPDGTGDLNPERVQVQLSGTPLYPGDMNLQVKVGDLVDVVGTTKGRGFAGVIKRYGFHRGPMTHGSRNVRRPGSVGCSAWPAKIIKGKKMPGHYGTDRKTIRNLEIVDIRSDDNLILVKGAVPGAESGLVAVNKLKFKQD